MKKAFLSILLLPGLLLADDSGYEVDPSCYMPRVSYEELDVIDLDKDSSRCDRSTESCAMINWVDNCDCLCKYSIEFRVGGIQPSNSQVNKIYGSSVVYELEWSWRQCFCSIDAWVNINYLSKKGRCCSEDRKTRLQLTPISFGIKRRFIFNDNFSLMAGFGASYTFAQGAFFDGISEKRKEAWGFVAKGGLIWDFCNGLYVDFFGDYYYTGLTSHGDTVNVGGFRGGIGLGLCY